MAWMKWCCDNRDCKMQNIVSKEQVDDGELIGKKILLVCANCGLIHKYTQIGTAKGANWLGCVPLLDDWITRIPTGEIPGGYVNFKGEKFDRLNFIIRCGSDPQRYLKWVRSGQPDPVHKC